MVGKEPKKPRRWRLLFPGEDDPDYRRGLRAGIWAGIGLLLLLLGYCAVYVTREAAL